MSVHVGPPVRGASAPASDPDSNPVTENIPAERSYRLWSKRLDLDAAQQQCPKGCQLYLFRVGEAQHIEDVQVTKAAEKMRQLSYRPTAGAMFPLRQWTRLALKKREQKPKMNPQSEQLGVYDERCQLIGGFIHQPYVEGLLQYEGSHDVYALVIRSTVNKVILAMAFLSLGDEDANLSVDLIVTGEGAGGGMSHALLAASEVLAGAVGIPLITLDSINTTMAPSASVCIQASAHPEDLKALGEARGVRRLNALYHAEGFRPTRDACASDQMVQGASGEMSKCVAGNLPAVEQMSLAPGLATDLKALAEAFQDHYPVHSARFQITTDLTDSQQACVTLRFVRSVASGSKYNTYTLRLHTSASPEPQWGAITCTNTWTRSTSFPAVFATFSTAPGEPTLSEALADLPIYRSRATSMAACYKVHEEDEDFQLNEPLWTAAFAVLLLSLQNPKCVFSFLTSYTADEKETERMPALGHVLGVAREAVLHSAQAIPKIIPRDVLSPVRVLAEHFMYNFPGATCGFTPDGPQGILEVRFTQAYYSDSRCDTYSLRLVVHDDDSFHGVLDLELSVQPHRIHYKADSMSAILKELRSRNNGEDYTTEAQRMIKDYDIAKVQLFKKKHDLWTACFVLILLTLQDPSLRMRSLPSYLLGVGRQIFW